MEYVIANKSINRNGNDMKYKVNIEIDCIFIIKSKQ